MLNKWRLVREMNHGSDGRGIYAMLNLDSAQKNIIRSSAMAACLCAFTAVGMVQFATCSDVLAITQLQSISKAWRTF